MHLVIFVFLIFKTAANPPTCPAGVTCPSGGIWSEWENSPIETCKTSCGSCSTIVQQRNCLSEQMKDENGNACICKGESERITPCNTEACRYPAQKTCCEPYKLMVFNGALHCGPFEDTNESSDTAKAEENTDEFCCPADGSWTQWSSYARNKDDTAWIRTRSCTLEEVGCPCTGSNMEEITECPCTLPTREDTCIEPEVLSPESMFPSIIINHKDCTGTITMETSNEKGNFCLSSGGQSNALIYTRSADDRCRKNNAFPCNDVKRKYNSTITCDFSSEYYRLDFNSYRLKAFVQALQ